MKIIIDTREQKSYSFSSITPHPPTTIIRTLKTGDYSLDGFDISGITLERKSLSDLFGSLGKGRKRFVKELERMAEFDYAAVIIEAEWSTVIRHPPTRSKLNPKSVYSSIIAWQQRYGIHFWCCPGRAFAEKTTYRILERYWKDHMNGKRLKSNKDRNSVQG